MDGRLPSDFFSRRDFGVPEPTGPIPQELRAVVALYDDRMLFEVLGIVDHPLAEKAILWELGSRAR
jgi:hypothetical protein